MKQFAAARIHPWRDAAFATVSVLLVAIVGLGLSYRAAHRAQIEAVQNELRQLATTLAVQIDGDLHRTIRSEAQAGSSAHLQALAPIGRFLRASKDIIYAYTAVLEDGEIHFILNGSYVYRIPGDPLPPDPIGQLYDGPDPEFRQALLTHQLTVNSKIVRESSRRSYMSAYAPFYDSHGGFVGVVGVDMWTRDLENRLTRMERAVLVSGLAVVVLAMGIGAVVYRLRRHAARHESALARSLMETGAARERAERADAVKTRLVGIASHDLKSPLRAIIAATDLIAQEPQNTPLVSDLARRMHRQGERMFGLIRDLLDVAALESGRLELQRATVDLAEPLREVTDLLQARAQEKQQTLVCTATGDCRIAADRARVQQVLENLVDNALKFTPPGGTVRIELSADEQSVRVMVTDEGPGLSPEDYGRIFQPFQTLSAAPTGDEPSTGLGLYIAREIIASHGGRMVVDSVPGQGATFGFELPAWRDASLGEAVAV